MPKEEAEELRVCEGLGSIPRIPTKTMLEGVCLFHDRAHGPQKGMPNNQGRGEYANADSVVKSPSIKTRVESLQRHPHLSDY